MLWQLGAHSVLATPLLAPAFGASPLLGKAWRTSLQIPRALVHNAQLDGDGLRSSSHANLVFS